MENKVLRAKEKEVEINLVDQNKKHSIYHGGCGYECEEIETISNFVNPLLAEERADIKELLKSIDEYHETFSCAELESFSREKMDAGVKMMRLKNKVSEHFS